VGPERGRGLRLEPSAHQYRVGQVVRACFTLPFAGRVVLTDVLAGGSSWEIVNDYLPAGDYCREFWPGPDDGRECIRMDFRAVSEQKCFQVLRR
jgi:hypothetical protein